MKYSHFPVRYLVKMKNPAAYKGKSVRNVASFPLKICAARGVIETDPAIFH